MEKVCAAIFYRSTVVIAYFAVLFFPSLLWLFGGVIVCACVRALNGVFCESELAPTSHLVRGECLEQSYDLQYCSVLCACITLSQDNCGWALLESVPVVVPCDIKKEKKRKIY